jgi:hypothetical protein
MKFLLKNEKTVLSKLRTILRALLLIVLIALVPAAYLLPRMLIKGGAAEFYSEVIFPFVSFVPMALSGVFMISLTEAFVVLGSAAVIVLLVLFVIRCLVLGFKYDVRHLLHFLYKVARNVLIIAIAGALVFECLHGINYNRKSVIERMHLYGDVRPLEDYQQTLLWSYIGMINARNKLGQDYNGVAHMMSNFDTAVYDANIAVSTVSIYYDLGMSENYVRAKPVALSRLWSYTGIVGVYDPFLGESNINTDYMDVLHTPVTICHEICHARGYASETDANTIAVLSCINSDRPDFQYAGYYYIFVRLLGKVTDYEKYEGVSSVDYLSSPDIAGVIRDMKAYERYREIFNDGPIADFIAGLSEDVNNAFLESNGQEGGTDTYVVPYDTFVEYYCRCIREDA